jgi:protein O-mannosyl-transferase
MANKYHLRRRALKGTQSRPDIPYALLRDGTEPDTYPPLPRAGRPWQTAGICLGLVISVVLLYVQTCRHDFTVCDDNDYIWKNPPVMRGLNPDGKPWNQWKNWAGIKWAWDDSHAGNWHPLTWVSHMVDWQVFGEWQPENKRYVNSWAGGHHLVNMAIHCANAVLLFLALRLMTGTIWPCVVVAVLFAVHPLRVESVAWAAERKDVLCGLFWMATMLTYAFYARRRPLLQSPWPETLGTLGIYALTTLWFGLALLAKSMAVTLPCVLLLLDAWPLDRWRRALWPAGPRAGGEPNFLSASRLLAEKLPWFGMVYYDCLQTVVGQDKGVALNSLDGLPMVPRLINALISIGAYLRQFVWPTDMAPFYPHPHMYEGGWCAWTYFQAVIGGVILAVVTVAVIWFWRKSYLAVGWFWFLGALVPVIGILQVGTQARADRYTYLPMIGVYLMLVWLLKEVADRWSRSRIVLAAVAVPVFSVLGIITFQQVSYWINSYVLFEHTAAVTDHNWFAYNHLGIQYDHDGNELMKHDVQAGTRQSDTIAFALKKWNLQEIDPGAAQTLLDRSADNFQSAIDIKPDYDFGNNNLGVYYARKPSPEDLALAAKYFRGALRSNRRYADAYNNLGIVLRRQGDVLLRKGKESKDKTMEDRGRDMLQEAIASHLKGQEIRNDRASDHNNLCEAYLALDDWDDAKTQNELALTCDPNFVGAWFIRARLFQKKAESYKQNSELAKAAQCYEEIAKSYESIVRIDRDSPDSIVTRFQLAAAYIELKQFDRAIRCYTEVLEMFKANPRVAQGGAALQVLVARGQAYELKGDLNRAKEDFEEVARLVPQNPEVQEKVRAIREKLASPQH